MECAEPVLWRPAEPWVFAFDLPSLLRATVQNAVNETFSADIPLRFETAPDLVSGIDLIANGQKVSWNIANYLATLEKDVSELLKEKSAPKAKAEPKPATPAPVQASS